MTENMQAALDNVAAAERMLADAKRGAREIALLQLKAAQEACAAAGVNLPTTKAAKRDGHKTAEYRARQAEIMRQRWAAKTPEQRAAWQAKIAAGQRGNRNAAVN